MKYKTLHEALDAFRQTKDAGAFRDIYQFLSGKLYYVCLRYLKNEADAQDVLQETFVAAYRNIASYTGAGSFEGWVRRIAVNCCLQKLRLEQKHFAFSYELKGEEPCEEEDVGYIEREESSERLLKALQELPPGYRTILNLAILEDYSHREIGQLLNISESTSRSQLTRAKAALKNKLEKP